MAAEDPKLSVFFDADVVIAGSASTTGASHILLQLSELGLIAGVSSQKVRKEVERNLERKLPSAVPAFRVLADAALGWVKDPKGPKLRRLRGQADPKDLPILGAAIEAGCQFLVTFNVKDFQPKGDVIRVETPGGFLTLLRAHLIGLGAEEI